MKIGNKVKHTEDFIRNNPKRKYKYSTGIIVGFSRKYPDVVKIKFEGGPQSGKYYTMHKTFLEIIE